MNKRETEIWTLQEITDALKQLSHNGKKIVIPRFQRGQRWSTQQEDIFIDSIRRGYPVGTLLFYKTSEMDSNGKTIDVYTLVDGLQRSTAIYRYMSAPMKFFNTTDVDEKLVDDVFSLLGFPESQKNNIAPEIKKAYVNYIKGLKTFKTPQTYKLAKSILSEIIIEDPDIIFDELIEVLTTHLQNTIENHTVIAESEIPAVVYTGDEDELPEIFSRINSKGTPLNTYEIYAASWPQNDKVEVKNSGIINAVLAKYDALNDDVYSIQGYDRDEIRTSKKLTLFEYVFGFGKWLSSEFPLISFDKHLKADEVTPIGFELLDACLFDTKKIGEIYIKLQKLNVNHLERAIVDCIQVVDTIVTPITRFKGNKRTKEIKPIYAKNQILSIIAFVFRERYDINDLRHVKESWKSNENFLKKRIFDRFVYDIISVEWDQGGTKLHSSITSGRYLDVIAPTTWESALTNLFEKEKTSQKRDKFGNASKADIAFLNCIYLSKFTALDQLSLQKFDIEHIATKELMKELIKRTSEYQGLPVNCVANLCYLPEYENRAKGKKTFYQDTGYLKRVTLQDIEDKYSFTTSTDLEWVDLPFEAGDFEELKEEYLNFLQNRFEVQKLKFYEVMGVDPEEAKRTTFKSEVSKSNSESKDPNSGNYGSYTPIVDAFSHKFNKTFIKKSKTIVVAEDKSIGAVMAYSKMYPQGSRKKYWFAVHPNKIEECSAKEKYYIFSCSDDNVAVAFPMNVLKSLLKRLNVSNSDNTDKLYYHMVLFVDNDGVKCLLSHPKLENLDVTEYCIDLRG